MKPITVLLLVVVAAPLYSQTKPLASTLKDLGRESTSTRKLLKDNAAKDSIARAIFPIADSIQSNVAKLTNRLGATKNTIPALYQAQLADIAILLDSAQRIYPDSPSIAINILTAVYEDLSAKLENTNSVGVSSTVQTTIKLNVVTRKDGKNADGYFVRWSYFRYKSDPSQQNPFNNPTNNASENLPPGRYYVWIATSSGEKVQGRSYVLGQEKSDAETMFFDI